MAPSIVVIGTEDADFLAFAQRAIGKGGAVRAQIDLSTGPNLSEPVDVELRILSVV